VLALLGRRVALTEDAYSMHVLEGALRAIVPPLLAYGMRPLTVLRVMVPAFDAITPHRRLRLHAWLCSLLAGGAGAAPGALPRTIADLLMLLLARSVPAADAAAADAAAAAAALLAQFPAAPQLDAAALLVDGAAEMAVAEPTPPRGGPAADLRPAYADAVGSEGALRALRARIGALLAACFRARALAAQLQALPPAEEARPPPLPLVLSGHAASLAPY